MNWLDFNLDKTINEFEYTRKATFDINRIIEDEDYENKDADMIYEYLMEKTKVISFKDHLKRYIYTMAEIEDDFSEIEDEEYKEIIKLSFEERNAPYSFHPTTRKKGKILNDFVTFDHVRRETIFILGFGLNMSDNDVSDFLTKVNLESSFDFLDPTEIIYWFCYRYELSYEYAKKMLSLYDELPVNPSLSKQKWLDLYRSPRLFITNEKELLDYLKYLKTFKEEMDKEDILFCEFEKLYHRALKSVALEYTQTNEKGKTFDAEKLGPSDLEKILCNGVPVTSTGNLMKMSLSNLSKQFLNKRMGRARISAIFRKTQAVERFDLITLLFVTYAIEVEPDWPTERYLQYIEEINKVLSLCRMAGIYPVNPYEAFVLMCLMSDYPLAVYSEVLEKSYEV